MKKLVITGLLLAGASLMASAEDYVDFDRIQHWAGKGSNRAALVIDFQDGKTEKAFVWGYRWDGQASGEDMVRAIAAASKSLTVMVQYTGAMGTTFDGAGLSPDRGLTDVLVYDFEKAQTASSFNFFSPSTSMGQTAAPGYAAQDMCDAAIERSRTTGVIEHPINAFVYGYPSYDYDCWKLAEGHGEDPLMHWQAGWYDGYWSYWVGSNNYDNIGYSGLGMSSVILSDGDVNAWKYSVIKGTPTGSGDLSEDLEYAMADYGEQMTDPEPESQPVDAAKVAYWVGSGEKSATVVFQFNDGKGPENLVYGVRWSGGWDKSLEDVLKSIAESDTRMVLDMADKTDIKITYDSNDDGNINYNDHNAVTDTWNYYVKRAVDDGFVKVPGERFLSPNAVLVLSHQKQDVAEVELPYLLYRPALDADGVIFVPEQIDYAFCDSQLAVPAFIQKGDKVVSMMSTASWTLDQTLSSVMKMSGTQTLGKATFTSYTPAEGVVRLGIRMQLEGESSSTLHYSNDCNLTVSEPLRPVTEMHYRSAELESGLNREIDNPLVFVPANPTFTKITYASSNTSVATVNSTTGVVKATRTAGTATITATYDYNKEIVASYTVTTRVMNPVTDIILPFEGDELVMPDKGIYALTVSYEPADADIADYNITIENTDILTDFGKGKYAYVNLVAHQPGTTKVTLSAADGSGFERSFNVTVEPREAGERDFSQGTFILNEEWFGHTNGSVNYVDENGELHYRVVGSRNDGVAFGATACYAMIYGGRMYVMSKQPKDGGDPMPGGGRLTVVDASTMRILSKHDDIGGGDGRACVGVSPEKVYLGTTKGIFVYNVLSDEVGNVIEGTAGKSAYSGQVGDMVCTGNRVYAVQQSTGVLVIDTESDRLLKTIADTKVQGITRSADGNVWVASTNTLTCIDPATDEIVETVSLPSGQTITCDWGSWRPTQFFASTRENLLFWGFSMWEIGTDINDVKPYISLKELPGENNGMRYGTSRYDERTGEVIVMTELAYGLSAEFNTYHWVNPKTGEVTRTIVPERYYWFQAMPVFPDAYEPQILLDEVKIGKTDEPFVIDLAEVVSDDDLNYHPRNIRYSVSLPVAREAAPVQFSQDGSRLTITPVEVGETSFTVTGESNGRVVSKEIPVRVVLNTGIDGVGTGSRSITATADGAVNIQGCAGYTFEIMNVGGQTVAAFSCDEDHCVVCPMLPAGIYVVAGRGNGTAISAKIVIR